MRIAHSFLSAMLAGPNFQVAGAGGGGVNDPNTPRPDVGGEWPEGDLPEQMGGQRTTLMPGIDTFMVPANISQLWHDVTIEDSRPFLSNGQPNPTKGQKIKRRQVKFDRNNPLIVVGGAHDGEPMTATFSTNPRPRGSGKDMKNDPKTPWISDLAYVLEIGFQDKSRPKTPEALEAAINKYAGKTVRLEHGLTAQCRADKVRYILVQTQELIDPANPAAGMKVVESSIQDPSGQKGCGERYYTKDFKNPEAKPGEPQYDQEIECDCHAVLRGFENVERILPPLGQAPPAK